jgi:REP element-mobilizing transposase RayT
MSHSLFGEYFHVVFSTRNRYPWLNGDCQKKCHRYIQGIADRVKAPILEIGGIEDHVHILVRRPGQMTGSVFAKRVKGASSVWFKKEYPDSLGFSWQDGFASFSVSPSQIEVVRGYIQRQKEHHKTQDYLTELKHLLKSHGVSFGEKDLLA